MGCVMEKCRHCKRNKAQKDRRNLCCTCFRNPTILRRYPISEIPEPTQDEIDEMVAEQMKCLPRWWHEEKRPDEPPPAVRYGNIRIVSIRRPRWEADD